MREFTAWDRLLAERLPHLRDDDIVVLITDALRQADADHLDAISPTALDLLSEWPTAYGHLDALPTPVVIRGLSMAQCLRSSFLALSTYALRCVLPLATVRPSRSSAPRRPWLLRPRHPAAAPRHARRLGARAALSPASATTPAATCTSARPRTSRSSAPAWSMSTCSAPARGRGSRSSTSSWWTEHDVSIHRRDRRPGRAAGVRAPRPRLMDLPRRHHLRHAARGGADAAQLSRIYHTTSGRRHEVLVVDDGSAEPLAPERGHRPRPEFRLVTRAPRSAARGQPAVAARRGPRRRRARRRRLAPWRVSGACGPSGLRRRPSPPPTRGTSAADPQPGAARRATTRWPRTACWPTRPGRRNGYGVPPLRRARPVQPGRWLGPVSESRFFVLPRAAWEALGGYDERFEAIGGGLGGIDFYRGSSERARDLPVVGLLGEGHLHQVHAGDDEPRSTAGASSTTTSASAAARGRCRGAADLDGCGGRGGPPSLEGSSPTSSAQERVDVAALPLQGGRVVEVAGGSTATAGRAGRALPGRARPRGLRRRAPRLADRARAGPDAAGGARRRRRAGTSSTSSPARSSSTSPSAAARRRGPGRGGGPTPAAHARRRRGSRAVVAGRGHPPARPLTDPAHVPGRRRRRAS